MRRTILFFTCVLFIQGAFAASGHKLLPDTIKLPAKNKALYDTSGRPLRINRILIIGNRVTKEQIVLRELTVKPGDVVYSAELPIIIDLDKKKLINTRLFNSVEIRLMEFGDAVVDLLIDINERWYTFPAPIFELADRNFNEWWENYNHDFKRVNYGLRLYQFNMRGRNETLRLTAQFGFQRKFDISYRFPYIDKKQKQGLMMAFDFSESKNLAYRTLDHKLEYVSSQDILRVNRGGALTYTYRKSFYVSHALKIEYRSGSVDDTIAAINPRYFGEGRTSQRFGILSYQFTLDRRDYGGYPLVGHFLHANILRFGLTRRDDVKKVDVNVNFAAFINLKNNFFLSINTIGLWNSQDRIPYANFSGLGYRKELVRGYEVFVIEGPAYGLNKTTLKYRIFSRTYNFKAMPIRQFRYIPLSIYLKTYGDIGYVKGYPDYDVSNRLSDKVLTGVGAGLDIVASYDAVLRFEYSINGEGERGLFFHIKREF